MGWSTTVVAPPDGAMADYMASLDRLLERPEQTYVPGHGGPVDDGHAYRARARGATGGCAKRRSSIAWRRATAPSPTSSRAIYRDTDPRLHGAAGLSVLAHLEDLIARGGW